VNKVALTLPAVILPVTANELSVPTEVMLGCAAVVTVPAVVAEVAVLADPADPVTLIDQVPLALVPVVLGAPTVL
jgi:hypothetical protein